MAQEILTAGQSKVIPSGFGVRLSPISGMASFPRYATIAGSRIYFDGPGWKPLRVASGSEITVEPFSLPFAAPGSMLPYDSESWLCEVATECQDLSTANPAAAGAQQIVASEAAIWDSNKLSPFIDTRPFRQVDLYVVPLADGKALGGNFWVTTADLAGRQRSNGSAHVLNTGADNTTMRATFVRGGFESTALDDVDIMFSHMGPFVFLAYNTQAVVGKLVRFEAWGFR
jgi:hypothetical protein